MLAVVGPGRESLFLAFIDDNCGAHGCEWCCVEVEVAKNLVVGGEFRIYPGSAQHVEGKNCLGNQAAPEVWRETLISTLQDGDAVSFECLDGPFGEVVAVVICVG